MNIATRFFLTLFNPQIFGQQKPLFSPSGPTLSTHERKSPHGLIRNARYRTSQARIPLPVSRHIQRLRRHMRRYRLGAGNRRMRVRHSRMSAEQCTVVSTHSRHGIIGIVAWQGAVEGAWDGRGAWQVTQGGGRRRKGKVARDEAAVVGLQVAHFQVKHCLHNLERKTRG